jgi:tetratricopeptide (TPR) repeat protein
MTTDYQQTQSQGTTTKAGDSSAPMPRQKDHVVRARPGGCSPIALLRKLAPFCWVDDHFNEVVVVIIALVAVLVGLITFLQSYASNRYAADIRQSQVLATDALGYDMSSRERENYDSYLYTTWNEWDWRRSQAEGTDEALAARSGQIADMISPLTPLLDKGKPYFNPKTQVADFYAYHVDINLVTTTMLLEQRAFAIETANIWNGKADGYVTILTLLAVSLFLFGLSITIIGGLRHLFAIVGSFLVGLGLLWALILTLIPVPNVSSQAIAEYARGQGLHYNGDYKQAREAFDAALKAYPRYGNAYFSRGRVNLELAEYVAAVQDYLRAIENGRDDKSTYWELGWSYYLLGDYRSSVEASRRALEKDPNLLPVMMNTATALLAGGETEAAMKEYEQGLEKAVDPNSPVPASWNHLYLRLTVEDLDKLIAALDGQAGSYEKPDLSHVVDRAALRAAAEAARLRLKEGIVTIEAAGHTRMEQTNAMLSSIVFARSIGRNGELLGQGDSFVRGELSVVVALSYDNLPQGAIVSRRVMRRWSQEPDALEALPTMGEDITWSGEPRGTLQQVMRSPWPGDRGLRPGVYTVEYYVNGHLLQTGSFTIPDEDTLIIGSIVFAADSDSRGIPYGPASLFPAGVAEVHGILRYSGVPEGTKVRGQWYRNDKLYSQETDTIGGWGRQAFFLYDVPPGDYRLDLYMEGKDKAVQSASFKVVEVSEYLRAIGKEPDDALFHRNLGEAYAAAGDYQQAIARDKKATELDPQCAKCYYRWWSALYAQGNFKEAIEKLQKAIELRPKEYSYLCDLGKTYYSSGDDENAVAAYREAVPAAPAYVYNRWGIALHDQKRFQEAAVKYQQAIELKPDVAVYHYNLGLVYDDLQEKEKAIAELEKAAELAGRAGDEELRRDAEDELKKLG